MKVLSVLLILLVLVVLIVGGGALRAWLDLRATSPLDDDEGAPR